MVFSKYFSCSFCFKNMEYSLINYIMLIIFTIRFSTSAFSLLADGTFLLIAVSALRRYSTLWSAICSSSWLSTSLLSALQTEEGQHNVDRGITAQKLGPNLAIIRGLICYSNSKLLGNYHQFQGRNLVYNGASCFRSADKFLKAVRNQ